MLSEKAKTGGKKTMKDAAANVAKAMMQALGSWRKHNEKTYIGMLYKHIEGSLLESIDSYARIFNQQLYLLAGSPNGSLESLSNEEKAWWGLAQTAAGLYIRITAVFDEWDENTRVVFDYVSEKIREIFSKNPEFVLLMPRKETDMCKFPCTNPQFAYMFYKTLAKLLNLDPKPLNGMETRKWSRKILDWTWYTYGQRDGNMSGYVADLHKYGWDTNTKLYTIYIGWEESMHAKHALEAIFNCLPKKHGLEAIVAVAYLFLSSVTTT